MIARIWSARIDPGRVATYVAFFRASVRPVLERLPGFVSAEVFAAERESSDDPTEVVVETRWTDMTAVRGFAGEDPSRAVVEPEAAALFIDFDRTVRHYRIVDE